MKIALVHPSLNLRRGVEKIVLWLGQEFSQRGHTVSVVTSNYSAELHGAKDQFAFDICEIGGPGLGNASLNETVRMGGRLGQALCGSDIACLFGYPASAWAFFGKLLYGSLPPLVWYCNEPPRLLYDQAFSTHVPGLLSRYSQSTQQVKSMQLRTIMRSPSLLFPERFRASLHRILDYLQVGALRLILANSTFTTERLQTIYPRSTIKRCHLGVPLVMDGTTNGNGRNGNSRYILSVSHLHPIKNIDLSLKAVQLLRERGMCADLHYRIIGKGPHLQHLHELAASLGIADMVSFEGFASEEALTQAYEGAELLLYIPFDEPFGLPPLEAAVHAKTSVVSNHGGMVDTVVDGMTGVHVDPFNPQQVADALGNLLRAPDLRVRMGLAARKHVTKSFTLQAFADRLEHELQRAMGSYSYHIGVMG